MNSDLIEYYARRAREYEQVYRKPERQTEIAYLADHVTRAFSHQTVLEIACGTGYWTQYIAQTARSVVATDINTEVIEIAQARGIPQQKVTFKLADLYALPESSQQVDAGFGGFIWSHVPRSRLRSFLASFHRQIKKGGKVVFFDNRYVAGSSTPLHQRDEQGNTFQKRRLKTGEEYTVLKNFPSEQELRDTLRGYALDIQITWLKYFWIVSYRVA